MLISSNQFHFYKAPEYYDPNGMDILTWTFNPDFTPEWLKHYVKKWNLGPTQYCVYYVGDQENDYDGIFKFNFQEKNQTLISKSTLINSKYRKKGVAKTMWKMAIEELKPKKIIAFASTRDGLRFLNKLKNQYPSINWKIENII